MTDAVSRGPLLDTWARGPERYLPSYPDELFALIRRELRLPTRPAVVDLGAGTGRASLAMAALGWLVTAVEPDRHSLDVLQARATEAGLVVATAVATAEATGLDPASVDLVTAAQSFHWFDQPAALAEMARVVRPGGGTALFWNVRDRERSPFIAGYYRLLDRYGMRKRLYLEAERASGRVTQEALAGADGYGPPRLHQLQHELAMRPDDFVGMAFTPAYVRALEPEAQERFRSDVLALLAEHHFDGDRPFQLPWRTNCWLARRSER
jgi:SAM-dependent methyltransferase